MSEKFTCTVCNKDFSTKGSLKTHLETICNRSEELHFTCTFCTNNFSRKTVLDRHIKTCQKRKEYLIKKELEETKKQVSVLETIKESSVLTIEEQFKKLQSENSLMKLDYENKLKEYQCIIKKRDSKITFLAGQVSILKEQLKK